MAAARGLPSWRGNSDGVPGSGVERRPAAGRDRGAAGRPRRPAARHPALPRLGRPAPAPAGPVRRPLRRGRLRGPGLRLPDVGRQRRQACPGGRGAHARWAGRSGAAGPGHARGGRPRGPRGRRAGGVRLPGRRAGGRPGPDRAVRHQLRRGPRAAGPGPRGPRPDPVHRRGARGVQPGSPRAAGAGAYEIVRRNAVAERHTFPCTHYRVYDDYLEPARALALDWFRRHL
jgi:hypothetical protein